jgi:hypothetical protein
VLHNPLFAPPPPACLITTPPPPACRRGQRWGVGGGGRQRGGCGRGAGRPGHRCAQGGAAPPLLAAVLLGLAAHCCSVLVLPLGDCPLRPATYRSTFSPAISHFRPYTGETLQALLAPLPAALPPPLPTTGSLMRRRLRCPTWMRGRLRGAQPTPSAHSTSPLWVRCGGVSVRRGLLGGGRGGGRVLGWRRVWKSCAW